MSASLQDALSFFTTLECLLHRFQWLRVEAGCVCCWRWCCTDCRPTFNVILNTLDIWSAGGCGWPAVPLGSRAAPPKRMQQSQPQQQQDAGNAALPSASAQIPQQQQQADAGNPSQPSPQQQQPLQVQRAAPARTGGDAGGRNKHMSWSEVDVNQGYEG
jgi:hypothetical protein